MGLQFNLINCCYPSHPGVEGARALPRVFSRATPLKNSLLQSYRPQYRSDFGNQLHYSDTISPKKRRGEQPEDKDPRICGRRGGGGGSDGDQRVPRGGRIRSIDCCRHWSTAGSSILCLCAYEVNRDPLTQLERRRETEAAISARPAHIIQQRAENLLLYQNCKKWQRSKGKRLSLNAN